MTQPSSLLLVDADSHGLETLTYGFEREGCRVTRTSELGRAIPLATSAAPQLAVVMLRTPEHAGLEIIRGLRSAGGRALPIVAMGPAALKEEALGAGAADFLRTPTFIRDVVSVGRLTLTAARTAAGKPDETTHLTEYHGLFYLLRAMAATGRSGVVGLTRKGRRAELRVHEGGVVTAAVNSLQSLPALHHVLLWEDAALSLNLIPTPKRNQFPFTAQELLDECERFLRDFAHAARDLGPPSTLYVPVGEGAAKAPSAALQPLVPLLKMFDGKRVLADVIEESPFRIFDTVRMIKRLLDAGALAAREAPTSNRRGERRRPSAPQSMLEQWAMVPDQRGVVGDRRSASRPVRPLAGPSQVAPIPLTQRKGAGAGEIPAIKRRMTPARATDLSTAPTVQVKLDAHGMPIGAPVAPAAMQGGPGAEPLTPPPARLANAAMGAGAAAEETLPATPPPVLAASGAMAAPAPPAAAVSEAETSPPALLAPTATATPTSTAVPTVPLSPPPAREPSVAPELAAAANDLRAAPDFAAAADELRAAAELAAAAQLAAAAEEAAAEPDLPAAPAGALDSAPEPRLPPTAPAPLPDPPPGLVLSEPVPDLAAPILLTKPKNKTPIPLTTPKNKTPIPLVSAKGKTPLSLKTTRGKTPIPQPNGEGLPPDGIGLPGDPRKRRNSSGPHLTHANAFDDVEADFFAREADLYKREAVETFDDLDPVNAPSSSKKRKRKK